MGNFSFILMSCSDRLAEMLRQFQTTRPAGLKEIKVFEGTSGIALPLDFRKFLRFIDGGGGVIGQKSYAMLWKVSELLQFRDWSAIADRFGREIFEIQPIMLGGSPTDPANKTLLTREQPIAAVKKVRFPDSILAFVLPRSSLPFCSVNHGGGEGPGL